MASYQQNLFQLEPAGDVAQRQWICDVLYIQRGGGGEGLLGTKEVCNAHAARPAAPNTNVVCILQFLLATNKPLFPVSDICKARVWTEQTMSWVTSEQAASATRKCCSSGYVRAQELYNCLY